MSRLDANQLSSRRGFLAVGCASLTAALTFRTSASTGSPKLANPWAYDDSEFRKTDPKLIQFREIMRFPVLHSSARCVCLTTENHLLVGSGKYITEYRMDGKQLSEFAIGEEVRCLGIGQNGLVYVGVRDHIEVYTASGDRRALWQSPGKKTYLTSLAIAENDLFAADAGNRIVWRYSLNGEVKARIGLRDPARKIPGFILPSPFFDVEIAPDGLLRVTNTGRHAVEAYTFDGDLEFSWGKAGAAIENFCGCCNPINLAFLSGGRVVTFEKGIPRVKIYTAQGEFESVVAGAESFAENAKVCGPNDCTLGGLDGAVDVRGRIYILDLVAANIRVMEPKKGKT